MREDAELERFLLELYGSCPYHSPDEFRLNAFYLLRAVIPFDGAFWGMGTVDPAGAPRFYAHVLMNRPSELLDVLDRYRHQNFIGPRVIADLGTTFNSEDLLTPANRAAAYWRRISERFDIQHVLITGQQGPAEALYDVVALYRGRAGAAFSEDERLLKERIMPHLQQASMLNTFTHARQRFLLARGIAGHLAICDARGVMREAEPGFVELVRSVWPDWRGPVLPCPVPDASAGPVTLHRGGGLRLEGQCLDELMLLTAERTTAWDELTPRQREVAHLLAEGKLYKQIADELGLSLSTVNNHVNAVYAALGVRNKTELARQLSH